MERISYICTQKTSLMETKRKFRVVMSGEADAFLCSLRPEVRAKIIYNVDKVANGYIDKDLSRSSMTLMGFGSSELYIGGFIIVFLRFGILMGILWLSPHMDLSRRCRRRHRKRLLRQKR